MRMEFRFILFVVAFSFLSRADTHGSIQSRQNVPESDCLPKLRDSFLGGIKNFEGKVLQSTEGDLRPTIVVLDGGERGKDNISAFMQSVLMRMSFGGGVQSKTKKRIGPKLLVLSNLDHASKTLKEEIENRRPEEYASALARTQKIASTIAQGAFSKMVYKIAIKKSVPQATAVFRVAYPAISLGIGAKTLLHGNPEQGVSEDAGALDQMQSAQIEGSSKVSQVSADLDIGFVMDTKAYENVAPQVDQAIEMGEQNAFDAKYRVKRGLFGKVRGTIPRKRVWKTGGAAMIDEAQANLEVRGREAKEGARELLTHANPLGLQEHLMGIPSSDAMQVAILAPDGSVLKRYVDKTLDTAKVVSDYRRFNQLLLRNIKPDPDDLSCSGKKADQDQDGVFDSLDQCPNTRKSDPINPIGTIVNGINYAGCAEGQYPGSGNYGN